MAEWGLGVDHSTIARWVLRYAPESQARSGCREALEWRCRGLVLPATRDQCRRPPRIRPRHRRIKEHRRSESPRVCGSALSKGH
jgi:hypothetical protein